MIKNVIFDLGRVIYTFEPKDYLLKLGYNEAQADVLIGHIIASGVWLEYDRGTYTRGSIIEKLSADFPDMADDFQRILDDTFMDNVVNIMPANLEFFYDVKKRGFKVYILSNFFVDGFEHVRKRDAFFDDADGMVISGYEGLVKPEPAIYELILGRYNLVPNETIFIDDNNTNIEAAEKFGIHGIHFTTLDDCKQQFETIVKDSI